MSQDNKQTVKEMETKEEVKVSAPVNANNTMRTMEGPTALVREFAENILDNFIIGASNSLIARENSRSALQWDMALLDINGIQAIEKALVQRIEEGFYNTEATETTGELCVTIEPAVKPEICATTIYFVASNDLALTKFKDNVLKFARIGEDKQVSVKHGNINAIGRHSFKALIITGINDKEAKSVVSKAKAMKMGMGIGRIASGVSSNVGLASFVLVDEFAPAIENLAHAGAKIAGSATKTAIKVANTVAEEFNVTAVEVATIIADSDGLKQVPGTVKKAWGILKGGQGNSESPVASNSLRF